MGTEKELSSLYPVAAHMSGLVGRDITKAMLDSRTAELEGVHRFPAVYLPAFCEAVGSTDPIRMLCRVLCARAMHGEAYGRRKGLRRLRRCLEKPHPLLPLGVLEDLEISSRRTRRHVDHPHNRVIGRVLGNEGG